MNIGIWDNIHLTIRYLTDRQKGSLLQIKGLEQNFKDKEKILLEIKSRIDAEIERIRSKK